MGLFKKSEKTYTYSEVLKMMKMDKYENYVAIPVQTIGNTSKYLFIPEEKEQKNDAHKEFVSRISNNGAYVNNRSYNNYQQAKGYNADREYGVR